MSEIPADLWYTETHEWVREEKEGLYTIGITAHAQSLLGDIVFVELPDTNHPVKTGQECAVIESVKAAADVYAPIDGVVVEVNTALNDVPETINRSPYEEGWLFKVQTKTTSPLDGLLSAKDYAAMV